VEAPVVRLKSGDQVMRFVANHLTGRGIVVDRRRAIATVSAFVAAAVAPSRPAQSQPLALHTIPGIWRGQEHGPMGVMDVEVIFFPNGTYSRAHRLRDLMTRDVGTYSIVQNWIHFALQNYQPRSYKGQTLTRPMSDTWVVDQFDGRSMRATVGGISRVVVRRAR
jgi:hypothetical protein